MKFHPGVLAVVSVVSAAALASCDQRPQQACGTIAPDGHRIDCNNHHGTGLGWFFLGGMLAGRGGRSPAVSPAGVSRGGFGATAAGHAGGAGE